MIDIIISQKDPHLVVVIKTKIKLEMKFISLLSDEHEY